VIFYQLPGNLIEHGSARIKKNGEVHPFHSICATADIAEEHCPDESLMEE